MGTISVNDSILFRSSSDSVNGFYDRETALYENFKSVEALADFSTPKLEAFFLELNTVLESKTLPSEARNRIIRTRNRIKRVLGTRPRGSINVLDGCSFDTAFDPLAIKCQEITPPSDLSVEQTASDTLTLTWTNTDNPYFNGVIIAISPGEVTHGPVIKQPNGEITVENAAEVLPLVGESFRNTNSTEINGLALGDYTITIYSAKEIEDLFVAKDKDDEGCEKEYFSAPISYPAVVFDIEGPSVSLTCEDEASVWQDYVVQVEITDNVEVADVILEYGDQSIPMIHQGGNVYTATITAENVTLPEIEYQVLATDINGNPIDEEATTGCVIPVADHSAPQTPPSFSVTAGDGQLTVTWAPSVFDEGGFPLTRRRGYRIWVESEEDEFFIEVPHPADAENPALFSEVITGLENDRTYAVSIQVCDLWPEEVEDTENTYSNCSWTEEIEATPRFEITDFDAPEISDTTVRDVSIYDEINVNGTITDESGIEEVILSYSYTDENGEEHEIEEILYQYEDGDYFLSRLYNHLIPMAHVREDFEYSIQTRDIYGNTRSDIFSVRVLDDNPTAPPQITNVRGLDQEAFIRLAAPEYDQAITIINEFGEEEVVWANPPLSGLVGNELRFKVRGSDDSTYSDPIDIGNVTSYYLGELLNNETYVIQARTYDNEEVALRHYSVWSEPVEVTPHEQDPPLVENLTIEETSVHRNLTIQGRAIDESGVEDLQLLYKYADEGWTVARGDIGLSFDVETGEYQAVIPGGFMTRDIEFAIQATDIHGNEELYEFGVKVVDDNPPGPPLLHNPVSGEEFQISIDWEAPTVDQDTPDVANPPLSGAIAGYRIYYRVAGSGGAYAMIEINDPSITSYVIDSLAYDTQYEIKITALDGNGHETDLDRVEAKYATPGDVTPPGISDPTPLVAEADQPKTVTVTATDAGGSGVNPEMVSITYISNDGTEVTLPMTRIADTDEYTAIIPASAVRIADGSTEGSIRYTVSAVDNAGNPFVAEEKVIAVSDSIFPQVINFTQATVNHWSPLQVILDAADSGLTSVNFRFKRMIDGEWTDWTLSAELPYSGTGNIYQTEIEWLDVIGEQIEIEYEVTDRGGNVTTTNHLVDIEDHSAPAALANFVITGGQEGIIPLDWSAFIPTHDAETPEGNTPPFLSSPIDHFVIYSRVAGSGDDFTALPVGSVSSYNLAATNGVELEIYITAVDQEGNESPVSPSKTATPRDNTPPEITYPPFVVPLEAGEDYTFTVNVVDLEVPGGSSGLNDDAVYFYYWINGEEFTPIKMERVPDTDFFEATVSGADLETQGAEPGRIEFYFEALDSATPDGNLAVSEIESLDIVDTTEPADYTVDFVQSVVNRATQENGIDFTINDAELDANYSWTITDFDGSHTIPGNGIVDSDATLIEDLDLRDFKDGLITLTVTVTDASGNEKAVVQTINKDATAPLVSAANLNEDFINEDNIGNIFFQFQNTETDLTFSYTVSDQSGGSFTVSDQNLSDVNQIVNISQADLNTLADEQLTLSVTITDAAGNAVILNDTIIKDMLDPVIPDIRITNTTTGSTTHVRNGEDITITADISDDQVVFIDDITADLTAFGGSPNAIPDSFVAGIATWNLTGVTVAEGSLGVNITAIDEAGNSTTVASTQSFTGDNIPPGVTSATLNENFINQDNIGNISFQLDNTETTGLTLEYRVSDQSGGVFAFTDFNITDINQIFNIAQADLNTLADEQLDLSVTITDAAGNTVVLSDTIRKDTLDPTIPDILITNTSTGSTTHVRNGEDITITADISDDQAIFIDDITADLTAFGGSPNAIPNSFTGGVATWIIPNVTVSEGSLGVNITAIDEAGNSTTESSGPSLTGDNTPPGVTAVTLNENFINQDNIGNISFMFTNTEPDLTFSYTVSDQSGGSFIVSDLNLSDVDQIVNIAQADLETLADEQLDLSVTITDAAGNTVVLSDTIRKDTLDPTIPDILITNTSTGSNTLVRDGDNITITADISDDQAIFLDDITADLTAFGGSPNAIPDSFVGGVATWNLAAVTVADGPLTVNITATDEAGNPTTVTSTQSFTGDNTPPAVAGVVFNENFINQANIGNISFQFQNTETDLTFSYTVSDLSGGSFTIPDLNLTDVNQIVNISQDDLATLSDEELTLSVTITDAAGNIINRTDSIVKDTEAPTIPSVLINNTTITSLDFIKNGDDVTVTAQVLDNQSIAREDIFADLSQFGFGAAVNPNSYDGTTATWNLTGVTVADGPVTVNISAIDSAGNPVAAPVSDSITGDNTPPAAFAVGFVDGQTFVNGNDLTTTAFAFQGAETGPGYRYTFSISDGTTVITGEGDLTASDQQVTLPNLSLLADTTLTLSVSVLDTARNITAANDDITIEKDIEAPDGPTLQLFDQSTSNQAITNQSTIDITITGAAYAWYVSEDPTTPTEASAWETVRPTTFDLSAEGDRTVYVWARDEAGNITNVASAMIRYDATPPANPPSFTVTEGYQQMFLEWENPLDADLTGVRIVAKQGSEPADIDDGDVIFEGSGTTFIHQPLGDAETWYYKIFAYDEVPNYSSGTSASGSTCAGFTTLSLDTQADWEHVDASFDFADRFDTTTTSGILQLASFQNQEFNGTTIPSLMSIEPGSNPGCPFSVSGGKLNIDCGSNTAFLDNSASENAPLLCQSIPGGDFEAVLKIDRAQELEDYLAGFILYKDRDNAYLWGHNIDTDFGMPSASLNRLIAGSFEPYYVYGEVDGFPSYRKISKSGGNFTFGYSNDGSTWSDSGFSGALGFVADKICVGDHKPGTNSSNEPQFDYLRFNTSKYEGGINTTKQIDTGITDLADDSTISWDATTNPPENDICIHTRTSSPGNINSAIWTDKNGNPAVDPYIDCYSTGDTLKILAGASGEQIVQFRIAFITNDLTSTATLDNLGVKVRPACGD
ncbi:hypothetical protein ACFL5U_02680 [Candidatus Margulisiibacteriota bacterium]